MVLRGSLIVRRPAVPAYGSHRPPVDVTRATSFGCYPPRHVMTLFIFGLRPAPDQRVAGSGVEETVDRNPSEGRRRASDGLTGPVFGRRWAEMATIAPERPETLITAGLSRLPRVLRAARLRAAPYMKRIARAAFGDVRELVVCIPKGKFKTTMCRLLGLHHLLVTEDAEVRIAAGVRAQAEVCLKRVKGFARHEANRERLTITHFELRDEFGGDLTVVAGAYLHWRGRAPPRHQPELADRRRGLVLEGRRRDVGGDGVVAAEETGLEADPDHDRGPVARRSATSLDKSSTP
jgi:hypothetical protein